MRCPTSFHSRRAAFAALFAEITLFKREHSRGNVAYDGGFEILRDSQMPIIDAVARTLPRSGTVEDAARIGGGL